jgi:hypothetical protein
MRFILLRERAPVALAAMAGEGARLLGRGEALAWGGLGAESCFVVALGESEAQLPAPQAADPLLRLQPLQTP